MFAQNLCISAMLLPPYGGFQLIAVDLIPVLKYLLYILFFVTSCDTDDH